jgi:hypothetical protein
MHQYMTPDEFRDETMTEIWLTRLASGARIQWYRDNPDVHQALWDGFYHGERFRRVWLMVFLPNSYRFGGIDTLARAEAAAKRLAEGDRWEDVAIDDSDNPWAHRDFPRDIFGLLSTPAHQLGHFSRLDLIEDCAKLWETLVPDTVSTPQRTINGGWALVRWVPSSGHMVQFDRERYTDAKVLEWRAAAREAAAEALASSGE